MPKVPYLYEVNGKLVTENGSLIPICSLSNRSLLPSLTIFSKDAILGSVPSISSEVLGLSKALAEALAAGCLMSSFCRRKISFTSCHLFLLRVAAQHDIDNSALFCSQSKVKVGLI